MTLLLLFCTLNNALEAYAKSIGDNNVVEVRGRVGEQVELSTGCVVGVGCSITTPGLLPERTVIFGEKSSRRIACEKPMVIYLHSFIAL